MAEVGNVNYQTYMSARGWTLDTLPFAGNVVINHRDSTSTTGGTNGYQTLSRLASLKRSVRWLPTLRYASAAVRAEFAIPRDSDIPGAYRGGASVFWR